MNRHEKARELVAKHEITPTVKTQKDIARGWRRWVALDGPEDCQTAGERAGFELAAWENDNGGGARPRGSEAKEEALFLVQFAKEGELPKAARALLAAFESDDPQHFTTVTTHGAHLLANLRRAVQELS